MTRKTETMDLKGNDYSKVAERVKEFRKDCPNGLIETTPTIDGTTIVFKARVLKDKSLAESAEATGHAYGENKGAKAFEKLETVAVGRALALIGYSADGEIASSEEMEEFYDYQNQKREETIGAWTEKMEEASTLEELKSVWVDMPVEVKKELKDKQEEIKAKLAPKKKAVKEVVTEA